jgi:hypothetical protein
MSESENMSIPDWKDGQLVLEFLHNRLLIREIWLVPSRPVGITVARPMESGHRDTRLTRRTLPTNPPPTDIIE